MNYDNLTDIEMTSFSKIAYLVSHGLEVYVSLHNEKPELKKLKIGKSNKLYFEDDVRHDYSYKNKYFFFDSEKARESIKKAKLGRNLEKMSRAKVVSMETTPEQKKRINETSFLGSPSFSYSFNTDKSTMELIKKVID